MKKFIIVLVICGFLSGCGMSPTVFLKNNAGHHVLCSAEAFGGFETIQVKNQVK